MIIAYCDDLKSHRTELINMLLDLSPILSPESFYEFENAADLLESIEKGVVYDLVFLDVELHGTNGVDVGLKIRESSEKTIIIFVSAYPQYAVPAYECEPLYFLVKPVETETLKTVWKKVLRKYNMINQYYTIKNKKSVVQVPISDITYVEVFHKHLVFHTTNGTYESRGSLNDVLLKLQTYGFCRTHQGCIVNMNYIREINSMAVMLTTGDRIVISVRKRNDVLQNYADFVERV